MSHPHEGEQPRSRGGREGAREGGEQRRGRRRRPRRPEGRGQGPAGAAAAASPQGRRHLRAERRGRGSVLPAGPLTAAAAETPLLGPALAGGGRALRSPCGPGRGAEGAPHGRAPTPAASRGTRGAPARLRRGPVGSVAPCGRAHGSAGALGGTSPARGRSRSRGSAGPGALAGPCPRWALRGARPVPGGHPPPLVRAGKRWICVVCGRGEYAVNKTVPSMPLLGHEPCLEDVASPREETYLFSQDGWRRLGCR